MIDVLTFLVTSFHKVNGFVVNPPTDSTLIHMKYSQQIKFHMRNETIEETYINIYQGTVKSHI